MLPLINFAPPDTSIASERLEEEETDVFPGIFTLPVTNTSTNFGFRFDFNAWLNCFVNSESLLLTIIISLSKTLKLLDKALLFIKSRKLIVVFLLPPPFEILSFLMSSISESFE